MRAKLILLLGMVGAAVWYFGYWPWVIGQPAEGVIRYYDVEKAQYETVALSEVQLKRCVSLLRQTRPTFFLQIDHEGIGNEPVKITFHYGAAEEKVFSLWGFGTTLYEGCAEDLTMACMLGDWFHFGGWVDDELSHFLRELGYR